MQFVLNRLDVLDEISHSENFIILVYHSALILDDLADSDVRCHCGWPRYDYSDLVQIHEVQI
jgi:hypothetical protein